MGFKPHQLVSLAKDERKNKEVLSTFVNIHTVVDLQSQHLDKVVSILVLIFYTVPPQEYFNVEAIFQ